MDLPFYREYDLPWTSGRSQEKKFQRLLGITFLVSLALSLVWPFIPTKEPDPMEVVEIPPRIAQLLLEEKPLPPPPPQAANAPTVAATTVIRSPRLVLIGHPLSAEPAESRGRRRTPDSAAP